MLCIYLQCIDMFYWRMIVIGYLMIPHRGSQHPAKKPTECPYHHRVQVVDVQPHLVASSARTSTRPGISGTILVDL